MSDIVEEGMYYTAAIHDDELRTVDDSNQDTYHYHANIHDDETRYYDDLQESNFQYHSSMFRVPLESERMVLAATINRIANFELSRINQENLGCFKVLFQKLAREAIVYP